MDRGRHSGASPCDVWPGSQEGSPGCGCPGESPVERREDPAPRRPIRQVRLRHIGRLDPCGEAVLFWDATSRQHAFSYPPSAPSRPPSSDSLRTMSKAEDKPASRPNKLRRPHSPSPPDEDGDRTGSETRQPPPKRARKAINCEPCRNSKLKCDRYVRPQHRRPQRPDRRQANVTPSSPRTPRSCQESPLLVMRA